MRASVKSKPFHFYPIFSTQKNINKKALIVLALKFPKEEIVFNGMAP
jgi:hypothetical protein